MLNTPVAPRRTRRQKAVLGPFMHKVKYVKCDEEPKACADAAVSGVPSWDVRGHRLTGYQTLHQLAKAIDYSPSSP